MHTAPTFYHTLHIHTRYEEYSLCCEFVGVRSISCQILVVLSSQHIFNVHDLDLLGVAMSFGFNTPPRVNLNFATSGADSCDDFCWRFRSSTFCHRFRSTLHMHPFLDSGQAIRKKKKMGTREDKYSQGGHAFRFSWVFFHMLYAYFKLQTQLVSLLLLLPAPPTHTAKRPLETKGNFNIKRKLTAMKDRWADQHQHQDEDPRHQKVVPSDQDQHQHKH
jgi:hypothetical protein